MPDIFGNTPFGYGQCGMMKDLDSEVSLWVELSEEHLDNATLTIHVLTRALAGSFQSCSAPSNRKQSLELESHCAPGAYGHALGGYISGHVREWLRKQWHKGPYDNWMHAAPMPAQVIAAMEQTWKSVASRNLRKYSEDCGGSITEDGRFILNCFGNACDIAIYPDNVIFDDQGSVRFSCHNLDQARQQLTLLAGLAKLCELARADTS